MSTFEIYKRGQGKYTRITTFVAVMVIGVIGARALSNWLEPRVESPYYRFGIPTLLVALLGLLMFRVVNRPKSADFMIVTEGEMKKVSWSSQKEIVGSTKVVIVTAFLMAGVLFSTDLLFLLLFRWMGIIG